jgi:uncharacterized RDD family membrane protein YckC
MFQRGRQFPNQQWTQPANLTRRLGGLLYDFLIITALWLFAGFARLPFVEADAMTDSAGPGFQSFLFIMTFGFFAFFWLRTGQTLGMQAWRIRVQNNDGTAMSPTQALMRFLSATVSLLCAGLGFLWMLVSKNKTTWHDQFSDTVVVYVPSDKEISRLQEEQGQPSSQDVSTSDKNPSTKKRKKKK